MAIIHQATLTPSKIELLQAWMPGRAWFAGAEPLEAVGAYRFDDPDGEIGTETHLVRSGDKLYQVPVTYRPAPVEGAGDALLGATEHSVLGTRWVYDACADPVYVRALLTALLTGAPQAELWYQLESGPERRAPSVVVTSTGSGGEVPPVDGVTALDEDVSSLIRAGGLEVVVQRLLGPDVPGRERLTGTWAGQDEPVGLAAIRV